MSFISTDLPSQVRGDTWLIRFYIQDSSGTALDISGSQYWLTLKASKDFTDLQAAVQIGPVVPTPEQAAIGLVEFVANPDQTDIEIQSYFYDVQEVANTGNITTLVLGKVKVVKDVTLYSDYTGVVPEIPTPTALAIGELTKDMNGFVTRSTSTYSFDDASRTFTLTPISDTYIYYRGKEFILTEPLSIIIGATPGGRYIIFDPDTEELVENTNFPNILDHFLVCYVYWDGSTAIILGDERHSVERDTTWHLAQHLNVGAVWRNGGEISYTLEDDTNVELSFQNITIADEDLIHNITHSATGSEEYSQILSPSASLPVLYLDGTNYTQTTASTIPWVLNGTRAVYNPVVGGNGSLATLGNGNYVTYWVLATNDSRTPIKLLMGNIAHATQKSAEAETFENYGLSFPEIVPLYKIVLETKDSYDNGVILVSVNQIISRLSTATSLAEANSGFYAVITNPPSTSTSAGSAGYIAYDTSYLYVCINTNTWRRIPLETW